MNIEGKKNTTVDSGIIGTDFQQPLLDEIKSVRQIDGKIDLFNDVVNWFRGIYYLDQERHVPFICDAKNDFIHNILNDFIPYTSSKEKCLFMGVFDEKTEEIVEHLLLEADGFDEKLFEVLGGEPLVVLQ